MIHEETSNIKHYTLIRASRQWESVVGYFSSETLEVPAAADVGGEWLLSRLVQAKPVKKLQLNKCL